MNRDGLASASLGGAEPFLFRAGRHGASVFRVASWSGREASSKLFRFDIEVIVAGDGWPRSSTAFALKRHSFSTRSYCVQYQESDYTFFKRLLAEEGLSFHFEQAPTELRAISPERTVLVMTDHNELAPTIATPSALRFRPPSPGLPPAEEHMLSFCAQDRVESRKLTLAYRDNDNYEDEAVNQRGRGSAGESRTSVVAA